MKKKELNAGLQGLLQPAAQEQPAATSTPEKKVRHSIASYSLPVELIEDIRYIAYYDRKTISAVLVEALTAYKASWKPSPEPQPRELTK